MTIALNRNNLLINENGLSELQTQQVYYVYISAWEGAKY